MFCFIVVCLFFLYFICILCCYCCLLGVLNLMMMMMITSQGVSRAFSRAYHTVDARQKLVRMCGRAGSWLIRCCGRVRAVDVYSVARDVDKHGSAPMIYHVLTTSHGRVVNCDRAAPIRRKNLFLSVLLPPLPRSDSAPKPVVGVSHRVFHSRLKTHLFSRSFPSLQRNLPLSL